MNSADKIKSKIISRIDEFKPLAFKIAEYIFDNPEPGGNEFHAKELLVNILRQHSFIINKTNDLLSTSFKASYNFHKPGPCIAFIAEYDALPGIGHACHHHIIAASSVCSAIALSKLSEDIRGKILVLGTPAEEISDAKGIMYKNGDFEDADAALMFHGGPKNCTELILLATDGLEFSFKGKAAHAAVSPHEGINALDPVILLFNSINALRQQLREDVRIHGIITEGGEAVNIIPEKAAARFYIRSQQRKYLNGVTEKIINCAKGAAIQTGTKLKINVFENPGNNLLKNSKLISEFENNFKSLGGEIEKGPFMLGSSDIGNLSHRLPVLHPMLQTSSAESNLHSREFLKSAKTKLAYDTMVLGMKSLSLTAARLLLDSGYLSSVKKEFEKSKSAVI